MAKKTPTTKTTTRKSGGNSVSYQPSEKPPQLPKKDSGTNPGTGPRIKNK